MKPIISLHFILGDYIVLIRIIVGPDVIKKAGLDRVGRTLLRRLNKIDREDFVVEKCEILFLDGASIQDISYLLRNMLNILDTELTIRTRVDPDTVINLEEVDLVIKVI